MIINRTPTIPTYIPTAKFGVNITGNNAITVPIIATVFIVFLSLIKNLLIKNVAYIIKIWYV